MLSHEKIWAAIDALAARHSLSTSGLARRAGLDSTAFNKSKRHAADGRPRWPSTESLAKIMEATGSSLTEILVLFDERTETPTQGRASVPLIGFAQAGGGGFFDDGGFPVGQGWEEIALPTANVGENAYALQVQGDSMLPLYRDGDILIIEPGARIRKGDRVIAKTISGEVMAKIMAGRKTQSVELVSLNPAYPDRLIPEEQIVWLARIVWASQ